MEHVFKRFTELSTREFYEICKERIAIFVVEQACPYQEIDETDLIAYHHFVKAGDELTAYARIYETEEGVHIGRVIVNSAFRGSGLGTRLLEETLTFIRQKFPQQAVMIGAQAHLQAFYEAVGFFAVSDEYLEDNIPHIKMKLR